MGEELIKETNVTEPTVPADGENSGGDPQSTAKPEGTEKTFTQVELDKIVADRISREKKKFETTLTEKLTEAEKLAKMNAEQKASYEKEKHEAELLKREQDITQRELKAGAKEILAEKKLPISLAEILNYTSSESCTSSIEAVQEAFAEAVTQGVNNALKQNPPGRAPEGKSKDPFLEGLGI